MLVNSMEDFWKGSIGTYIWRFFKKENDDISRRALLLKVPDIISDSREDTHVVLYVSHKPGNWAEYGEIMGWDGNEEFPTLNPSIQILNIVAGEEIHGWHGYLENGKLRNS